MAGNMPMSALVKSGQSENQNELSEKELQELAGQRSHMEFFLDRDDICERLGGGLPRRSLIMMKGAYGTGKSIISQRLLYGLLKNHHRVIFITTELTVKGFLDQMYSLKYNVATYLLKGQLQVFSLHQMLSRGNKPKDPLQKLERTASLFQSEILIIDTLSALAPLNIDLQRTNEVLGLFKRIVANGPTIAFTIESGELGDRELLPFLSSCEVLLGLEQRVSPMGVLNFLSVVRFAGAMTKVSTDFAFRVEPGIGIVPEITDMA